MGLDMYAYSRETKPDKPVDFTLEDEEAENLVHGEKFFQWRKHANLHGWMEALYKSKGGTDEAFNVSPVLLEAADLDALEAAVTGNALPHTTGFFFGQSLPEDRIDDLAFLKLAREKIAAGEFVYYYAWW